MGILDRLNRLVRSNVSDLASGRSPDDTRRELKSSLREARRQQAELRRDEKQIIESIREARAEAEKWEERAMLALEHEDEELARDALKAKNRAVRRADSRRDELEDHRSYMEDIEAALSALEQKLDAHRDRTSTPATDDDDKVAQWDRRLRARHGDDTPRGRPAEPDNDTGDTDFDTGDTFSEFDRMAGKINEMEAGAEAMRELNEDLSSDPSSELEERFRNLESRSSDRDEREPNRRSDAAPDASDENEDDLADKKRRMDRLNELKDRFDEEEDS